MKGTDTMSDANELWPEEGELLVCTVKGVKENGAYLNLNGYGCLLYTSDAADE